MNTTEKLCLQWNDFKENITSSFKELRIDREFTDVTLACEDGLQIEAHKVVLASSSPFFMELLKKNKHPHPLIYMRGLRSEDLVAIMDFLYFGEANVLQENLDTFLALAEELRLKGLSGGGVEAEKEANRKIIGDWSFPQKKKESPSFKFTASLPVSQSEGQSLRGSNNDTTIALSNDKINVELQDLDEQIKSMITKSDLPAGPGKGKLATCNVCGKQGPYMVLPRHIEANHITGVSHACDICGKVSRSRNTLNKHISKFHKLIFFQDKTWSQRSQIN